MLDGGMFVTMVSGLLFLAGLTLLVLVALRVLLGGVRRHDADGEHR